MDLIKINIIASIYLSLHIKKNIMIMHIIKLIQNMKNIYLIQIIKQSTKVMRIIASYQIA
jgi:hypothetical protein